MDLHTFLFFVLAGLTGLCAVAVVVTQNIVRAAAWLLFTLTGAAGIYFHLGADFVGATQLIVYVGGILVLVVFGVMLTAQGPFVTLKASAAEWAIAGLVGLLLFGVLTVTIVAADWPRGGGPITEDPARSMTSMTLGQAFLGITAATPKADLTGRPGQEPRERRQMGYLLPFEVVSVHLLVVLIGAAYLARAKRRARPLNGR